MNAKKTSFSRQQCLLIFSFLITIFIYSQGLPGDFVFDDLHNIKKNELLKIDQLNPELLKEASFSSESGIFRRPVSMFTFAINHGFTGMDPVAMKITNIAIHLINGWLIFIFTSLMLKALNSSGTSWNDQEEKIQRWLPVIVTSLWLVHPYNLTSVLYIVQRMTSLSALFILAALCCWVAGRLRLRSKEKFAFTFLFSSLFLFLPLAIFSKENGLMILPYIVLIELVLFRVFTGKIKASTLITSLVIITIVCLFILAQLDFFQKGFSSRSFTITERVLTEFRIIVSYLRELIQPDISRMSLFHDDIVVSKTLFEPFSTVLSLSLITGCLLVAIISFEKNPLITFGLLFFFVGHLMESSIIALELVFEHRNYLPGYGILLLLSVSLISISTKLRLITPLIIFMLMIYFSASTLLRAEQWSSLESFYLSDLKHKPDYPRANHNAAELLSATMRQDRKKIPILYPVARQLYLKSNQLDPEYTAGLIGLIIASDEFGQDVDPIWFEKFKNRLTMHGFDHHRRRQIRSLSECYARKVCKTDKEKLEHLLENVLDDPRIKGKLKSKLAWIAANYYFHHYQDKKSHDLVLLAHENYPENADYLVEATKLAVGAERFKTALAHLQKIETLELSTKQQKLIKEFKIKIKQNE